MIGFCDDAKTPCVVAVETKAWSSAVVLNGEAGVVFATRICMIVRVFGPYPAIVDGAPPESVWSGLPV